MLFIFSTPELVRHLWQLKTVIFLHWCLICCVLLCVWDYRLLDGDPENFTVLGLSSLASPLPLQFTSSHFTF